MAAFSFSFPSSSSSPHVVTSRKPTEAPKYDGNFHSLPISVLSRIVSYGNHNDLCALDGTCRILHTLTQNACFWNALYIRQMCVLPDFSEPVLAIKAHNKLQKGVTRLVRDFQNETSSSVNSFIKHPLQRLFSAMGDFQQQLQTNSPYNGKGLYHNSYSNNLLYHPQPFQAVMAEQLHASETSIDKTCEAVIGDNRKVTVTYLRRSNSFFYNLETRDRIWSHTRVAPRKIIDGDLSEEGIPYLVDEEGDIYKYDNTSGNCKLIVKESQESLRAHYIKRKLAVHQQFYCILTPTFVRIFFSSPNGFCIGPWNGYTHLQNIPYPPKLLYRKNNLALYPSIQKVNKGFLLRIKYVVKGGVTAQYESMPQFMLPRTLWEQICKTPNSFYSMIRCSTPSPLWPDDIDGLHGLSHASASKVFEAIGTAHHQPQLSGEFIGDRVEYGKWLCLSYKRLIKDDISHTQVQQTTCTRRLPNRQDIDLPVWEGVTFIENESEETRPVYSIQLNNAKIEMLEDGRYRFISPDKPDHPGFYTDNLGRLRTTQNFVMQILPPLTDTSIRIAIEELLNATKNPFPEKIEEPLPFF